LRFLQHHKKFALFYKAWLDFDKALLYYFFINTTHKKMTKLTPIIEQNDYSFMLGMKQGTTLATNLIESIEQAIKFNECEGFGRFEYVVQKILDEHKQKIKKSIKGDQ
jgi:hypothetical protein